MRFDGDPFTSQCEKENKKAYEFQEFQIAHFQGSLSDDILAVKGLKQRAPNPAQYAADWFLFVSGFGNAYDFAFVSAAVCFFLLYGLVFYVYYRVISDVLSFMFFHVGYMGFLK